MTQRNRDHDLLGHAGVHDSRHIVTVRFPYDNSGIDDIELRLVNAPQVGDILNLDPWLDDRHNLACDPLPVCRVVEVDRQCADGSFSENNDSATGDHYYVNVRIT